MSGWSKKRLQEGALSALRTPENLPAPVKLVPAFPVPDAIDQREIVSTEGVSEMRPQESDARGENSRLARRAIAEAQAGEPEGVHFLYVRYALDVQRFVASLVKDDLEAENITQDIFAKLMKAIKKYDEREVPFAAWIMRVARNAALDSLRAKRKAGIGGSNEGNEEALSTEILGHDRALSQALALLPSDQREVLVLRHIVGFTPVEIATALQKSESWVHALHHRGRRTLQARLAELNERQHALQELVGE
jgi:RNA polymerase sigma-70 factor (ECF subfamily)